MPTVLGTMSRWGPFGIARKVYDRATRKEAPPPAMRSMVVLDRCFGKLAPGTITMLLSPPGHGKSTLLRALAGNIGGEALKGYVRYCGLSAAQLAEGGIRLPLLSAYVDQARADARAPGLRRRER